MDNKIENKKTAIEQKFNELKTTKVKLVVQAQILAKAIRLIDGEMKETRGAHRAVCELLELDPDKEAKRVEKKWQASQKAPAQEKPEKKEEEK